MESSRALLFQPIKVGRMSLQTRIVLAPMTRYRASKEHVPLLPVVPEFYKQRASTPGTLLITEGTLIAPRAGGIECMPGIWSDEQISVWKKVTGAVHAKGSFIYMQLAALGRIAHPEVLAKETHPYTSASDVPLRSRPEPPPRPLTTVEIDEYVKLYAEAASNAINRAGFDGVEVHCAFGGLVDQFLQDKTNRRTDGYGGSIEGRSRFALEVLEAVVKEIGADRTAFRISPWSRMQEMCMDDPKPTYSYLVSQIRERFTDFSYLHVIEPRLEVDAPTVESEENDFIRELWSPRPYIISGATTRDSAIAAAEKGDIVAVARHFTSNPDLPLRWRNNYPTTPYNPAALFTPNDPSGKGYIDFPFYSQQVE